MTPGALKIGVSGLRVEGEAFGVFADNLANVNTLGFLRQRAEFEDVFNRGVGTNAFGSGVRLAGVGQAFTQGSVVQTGLGTDLSINGEGFFIVGGSVNGLTGTFYSRAGQFHLDHSGTLVDPSGLSVLGRVLRADRTLSASIAPLTVPPGSIRAKSTTELAVVANLDASDNPLGVAFDAQNPSSTSSLATSMAVFDSRGASHSLDLYFNNLGPGQWEYRAVVRGDELTPNQPGTNVAVGSGTLSFTSDGALEVFSENQPISVDFAEATPEQSIGVDFGAAIADGGSGLSGTTQFSMTGGVSSQSQNGFASGALTGISVDSDGSMLGLYTNGRSVLVGQVQLAKFRAVESLGRAGQNLWMETPESGMATVSAPGSAGRGQLSAGSLESSDVDLGEEMLTMIQHQRAFSSKVLATADEMLSQLMQLKR